jgi:hypothetical protein
LRLRYFTIVVSSLALLSCAVPDAESNQQSTVAAANAGLMCRSITTTVEDGRSCDALCAKALAVCTSVSLQDGALVLPLPACPDRISSATAVCRCCALAR